jgi:hypothetical protein
VAVFSSEVDAKMKARQLIKDACYDPERLKVLFQAFDDAWEELAGDFGDNALAKQAARLKLANVVLDLGRDGGRDPEQIKNSALKTMARNRRTGAT